jgi:RNA polymerase sigma factor FliA
MPRYATRIDPGNNLDELVLESWYKSHAQGTERPASDTEICDKLKIPLDEFYQMLDRIKELKLGNFREMAGENSNGSNDPLIRYIHDPADTDSPVVLGKSEIRRILVGAINGLPEMEQLIVSLRYSDELTLSEIGAVLGLNENDISRLHTKAMLRIRSKFSG